MKKILKKLALSISVFLLMQSIFAQYEVDALRFSETDWQGSARFMGAGRAFGAVGAEFSALNLNPASIGLYKKSEVSFTPMTISAYKNVSDYNGTETPAQKVRYSLNSAGIVLALPGISSSLWKKFQIGYGYNRVNNYNTVFSIKGRSLGSTIGDNFADEATKQKLNYKNYKNWSSDDLYFGWIFCLIDTISGSETSYLSPLSGLNLKQSSSVVRSGGNDEMVFTFGTNYDDKLYLGATLGVPFIHFNENRTYTETNVEPDAILQSFKMTDELSVRATGINLKLGVNYQPFNFLRVGAAFHTPTYYGIVKETYDRIFYAVISGNEVIPKPEEYFKYPGKFKYSLTTPLRAMVNMAFFIAKQAFISAEYEITDYSMANMYAVDYNFDDNEEDNENQIIQLMYGACHTARIGAEMNLSPVFAIRAGYNYTSSPFKNKINDGSKHYASAGFGFRTKHFYGDFAYALTISKEKYWMYDAQFVNAVNNKFITHRIMMSMGVRF